MSQDRWFTIARVPLVGALTLSLALVACDRPPSTALEVKDDLDERLRGVALSDTLSLPVGRVSGFGRYGTGYYLLDGVNSRILVVSPQGEIKRIVGRFGGGPGEFRSPRSATVASDGRLALIDEWKISVFDNDGTFLRRFSTTPFTDRVAWGCGDSVLIATGYSDVSGPDIKPAVEFYSPTGERLGATGSWPAWSAGINSSISMLMVASNGCNATMIEAWGNRIGDAMFERDPQVRLRSMRLKEVGAAQIAAAAVAQGQEPSKAIRSVWLNRDIWALNGDSVIIRQDSVLPDRSTIHRYVLLADTVEFRTRLTGVQIWEIKRDSVWFAQMKDDGSVTLGGAPVSVLLQAFSERVPDESDG